MPDPDREWYAAQAGDDEGLHYQISHREGGDDRPPLHELREDQRDYEKWYEGWKRRQNEEADRAERA